MEPNNQFYATDTESQTIRKAATTTRPTGDGSIATVTEPQPTGQTRFYRVHRP